MSDPPSDAAILAWARLVKVEQVTLGAVEADVKAAGHPPLAWYDVLLELRRAPGGELRPLQLEDRLLLAQHNVSRLIDRLVAAGLVRRTPCAEDGRGQMIVATEEGRALVERMWPDYRSAIQRRLGAKLTEAEAKALADLLGKVLTG